MDSDPKQTIVHRDLILRGNLKIVLQWDLDHHEPCLYLDDICLTHLIQDHFLPDWIEGESMPETNLGEFEIRITSSA